MHSFCVEIKVLVLYKKKEQPKTKTTLSPYPHRKCPHISSIVHRLLTLKHETIKLLK